MNGIQVLKKVKEKIKKINNVLTKHRHGHGHEHDRGEQHIPDDHDLDDKDAEEYDVGQIDQQGHGGAPGMSIPYLTSLSLPVTFCSGTSTRPQYLSRTRSSASSCKTLRCVGTIRKRGVPTMTTYNTPVSLLSLTEDVTRTFVPGEQLRVNIERDRGMEEGMAAQSFNSLDPCCFRISAGGEVGAAQLLQRGKEHVMMFNYSWKREGIQYKKNQQAQARLLQGYYYVYWYLLILVLFLHDQLWD
ncbi:unnamed protein product [Brassica oleracea var. botrytis]